jgi:hypothetical protein
MTDQITTMLVENHLLELQKRPDFSEKLAVDLQGWREHDIVAQFQITIQEIQRGSKKTR